jgi:ABC-2 type transport system permease protein
MNELRKFLRIYWATIRFSMSRVMFFRLDFVTRFFMDVVYYIVNIGFFEILFMHTDHLGGWRHDEVRVFIATALLLDSLFMMVIARNLWEFPSEVNTGTLDGYLTRPVNPFFVLLFRHFQFPSLLNFLVGIGFMGYAISEYQAAITVWNVLGILFMLLNSFVLMTCFRLFSVLPVFWTHARFGFNMLFQSFDQVSTRPEVIFRGVTHFLFLTIFPVFVITSFPARAFMGKLTLGEAGFALVVTVTFACAVRLVWRAGLRSYSSASS